MDGLLVAQAHRSPDKVCIASVGVARQLGRYESVVGHYPVPFGAVVCRPGL